MTESMPAAATRLVSLEEYLTSPEYERFEYEAGVVTEKPMPNWMHGELCTWIAHLLLLYFPKYKNGTEVRSRLKPESWKLPDLTVALRSAPREKYAFQPPYLNIEVLSEGDTPAKMFAKCRLYHEWGVPYCWVIDGENRKAWELSRGEEPRQISKTIRAGDIELSVQEIFSCLNE